jgi:hypothetical protein
VIVGGGKDGLPIILGNVDGAAAVPPQPGGTRPEGDPASKTTAASPARPLETTKASGLTEPSEMPLTAPNNESAAASPVANAPPSSAPRSSWPFSQKDVEKVLSRLVHPQESATTPAPPSATPQTATPAEGKSATAATSPTTATPHKWQNVIPAVPPAR